MRMQRERGERRKEDRRRKEDLIEV